MKENHPATIPNTRTSVSIRKKNLRNIKPRDRFERALTRSYITVAIPCGPKNSSSPRSLF